MVPSLFPEMPMKSMRCLVCGWRPLILIVLGFFCRVNVCGSCMLCVSRVLWKAIPTSSSGSGLQMPTQLDVVVPIVV